MSTPEINGAVADGFERVADEFTANFARRGDTGAACTVYRDGEVVVDLWAGEAGGTAWMPDTRSILFSVSKGVTTVCVMMAVEEGLIDLDATVTRYWPEFGVNGKANTTVRDLLSHRAGLVAPDAVLTIDDLAAWDPVCAALADQAPLWEPGTAYGYHAITFGWLAGEVLRRATGLRPGEWLRNRICEPLGITMTFGATPGSDGFALMEPQLPSADEDALAMIAAAHADPLVTRVMGLGIFDGIDLFGNANRTDFLAVEMPAVNLVGTARGLARLYAATVAEVDGVRLLGDEVARDACEPRSFGAPFFGLAADLRWGTGFMIDSSLRAMAGPGSFGHDGAGGVLGFANLEHRVGFGYQTIRPGGIPDDRAEALCRALRECL